MIKPELLVLLLLALVISGEGRRPAHASDLGPKSGRHAGRVVEKDPAAGLIVLGEDGGSVGERRVSLWVDPHTTYNETGGDASGSAGDVFRHGQAQRAFRFEDLRVGDRVVVEYARSGSRHVATRLARLPRGP